MRDPDLNRKIGHQIRILRDKYKLTQERLAEKSGLSAQHVQRLECGKSGRCFVSTIRCIASAFGLTLSEFFENC